MGLRKVELSSVERFYCRNENNRGLTRTRMEIGPDLEVDRLK